MFCGVKSGSRATPTNTRARIADVVFHSSARVFLGVARLPDLTPQNIHDWIVHEGLENLREAQAHGKGVLIATGHLGNWEFSVNAHTLLCGDNMNVCLLYTSDAADDLLCVDL